MATHPTESNIRLEVRGLLKRFGRRTVVKQVDLNLGEAEVVGLLGPNGAGKSTIFRLIIGLAQPDGGTIRLDGKDLARLSVHRRSRLGFGYLAQEPTVFRRLSVRSNLKVALEAAGVRRRKHREAIERTAKEMKLSHLLHQRADALSGGERRRLEIARLLLGHPRLVLFDEPFAGIDPITIAELKEYIRELTRKGIGVLLTDHQVREALELCDRAYILNEGTVLCSGTPAEVVESKSVRTLYLGEGFRM